VENCDWNIFLPSGSSVFTVSVVPEMFHINIVVGSVQTQQLSASFNKALSLSLSISLARQKLGNGGL
jgi:hypothetical protein